MLTWSWWAFFGGFWFFIYRKDYIKAFIYILCATIMIIIYKTDKNVVLNLLIGNFFIFLIIILPFMIIYGIYGKYFICKKFCNILLAKNDEYIKLYGGVNKMGYLYVFNFYIFKNNL